MYLYFLGRSRENFRDLHRRRGEVLMFAPTFFSRKNEPYKDVERASLPLLTRPQGE